MKKLKTNTSCIFTIVSKNYLPYARTLMASVKLHLPDSDLIVIICDRLEPTELSNEIFEILPIQNLNIHDFDEFVFKYTILELNTAVKPFSFEYLFSKQGYSKVIYFDPDIRVYGSLQGMLDYLDDYQIVITPHLTGPLNDGLRPDEKDILKAGTYNLGFIALSDGKESRRFLSWWSDHLHKECIVDIANGIFVDQKWIDLVPGMYESVKINRDPGWNAAYWNLLHRNLTKNNSGYLVNDVPLTFFHFSGIKAKDKIFSIHQNRYQYHSLYGTIRELVDDYIIHLVKNDSDEISASLYTYGNFDDGAPIPDVIRYAYRRYIDTCSGEKKFSMAALQPWLIQALNEPITLNGVRIPAITRLGYEIYLDRHDLQVAFPDLSGSDAITFSGWLVSTAKNYYELPDELVFGTRGTAFSMRSGNTDGNGLKSSFSLNSLGSRAFFKYKQYPNLYKLLSRFTSPESRGYLRNRLLRISGKENLAHSQKPVKINIQSGTIPGVNIIGYLHAESGTGEAARSTIRALKTTNINVSAIDVRFRNISRMEEVPSVETSQEQKYKVNIFHINADQSPVILNELGTDFYDNHYNIGFWFWELGSFPDCFDESFRYLDEIWVASRFCQEAISLRSPVPVVNIPLCIELEVPEYLDRHSLGLPQEGFIFLSIMDVMSIPERKNPLGVLEAFHRAFPPDDRDIYLVLKLSNMERCPKGIRKQIRAYLNHPNIILLEKYMKREELNSLLISADCYFSMHRSEGFGLPIAESMYMGKPVIATGWSSNMDFMNLNNSLPLKYELVELSRDYGPYKKGNVWADPDIDHAIECLKKIYQDKELRNTLGEKAYSDIRNSNSASVTGKLIRQRLEFIG